MMRSSLLCCSFLHVWFLLIQGSVIHGLDYDYSATIEENCLEEPWNVHYRGGILANPGFDNGIHGWTSYGKGKIKIGETKRGNKYVVAFNREISTDSLSHKVELEEGKLYAFSGWVQVNEGNAAVSVFFKIPDGSKIYGGEVMAQQGCWKMLKGGISNTTSIEIWADNIALQPFTEDQWRSHQEKTIQKVRKTIVNFHMTYTNKTRVTGAKIFLKQRNPSFPIGVEINYKILTNKAYQEWFTSRFTVTAFGNEMKWYSTEKLQGQENYTIPDAMMRFSEQHNIAIRGHNVLWDDPRYQTDWVTSLSPEKLEIAVQKRINSVVSRYKGRLIHWDVVNENVHFRFYEHKLGENASAIAYGRVHELDSSPILFMNEYNTIEDSDDQHVTPEKYLNKLKNILDYCGNGDLPAGIGLQSRFSTGQPNLVYMRAGMDTLAATNLPLWLTEVEGYAHPAVEGIVIWPSTPLYGTCKMCLTDDNFFNTATGDVVDKLINEWGSKNSEVTIPCDDGSCSFSLSHGEYNGIVWHPDANFTTEFNVRVVKEGIAAESYVHVECLEEPWSVQYRGGILENPGFDNETQGWTSFGNGNIKINATKRGNKFIAAFKRQSPIDSFSQRVVLEDGKIYAFSGWVQVSEGNATISVVFKTANGEMIYGGGVMAQHGCWRMLKGGIVSNFSGPAHMILKSYNTAVEIWADNFALQPFTHSQWRSHQDQTIQKVRKSTVKIHTSFGNKSRATGSKTIALRQMKPHFPIGSVMNDKILTNPGYQNWLSSRFSVTTFENEMKWYSTENVQGKENYRLADAMVQFAEEHRIAVRGHNVLWDDPKYQPYWVNSLSPEQLQVAVQKRIDSLVSRYRGRVIHWDVVNENVHFGFFENKLGRDISSIAYGRVHQLDSSPIVFMNEYNTIEEPYDKDVAPQMYLRKLQSIMSRRGNANLPLGIGLESRFSIGKPNLAYMRAGMDTLGATRLPLWLTEVFVDQQQDQAQILEQVLREGYAHPAVKGIVMWPNSPLKDECKMCFTDANFRSTPCGDVVDKLIKEWGSKNTEITVECDGSCSVSLAHGEYEGFVSYRETNVTTPLHLEVKEGVEESYVHVQLDSSVMA
ncbi:hypothetical protein V2J09_012500 [Rumex salicifolius]